MYLFIILFSVIFLFNLTRASTNVNYIFTTSTTGGNLGGRSGADSTCQGAQPAFLLCSDIRALIGVTASDELRDFASNYGVNPLPLLAWPSNLTLHTNTHDFLTGQGSLDNTYSAAGFGGVPWTGSLTTGALSSTTCTGWTTSSGAVNGNIGGDSGSSGAWLDSGIAFPCSFTFRLYCMCIPLETNSPTLNPTLSPTLFPTFAPTLENQTFTPTLTPSKEPTTYSPSKEPTTYSPTTSPTTYSPSLTPTTTPTIDSTSIHILYRGGGATGNLGGRSGANAICLAIKPAQLYCTDTIAVLGMSASDEVRDIPTNYGLANYAIWGYGVGGFVQIDDDTNDFFNGANTLVNNINSFTASLSSHATGALTNGALGSSCSGFTSTTGSYSDGSPISTTSGGWLSTGSGSCSISFPYLCLCSSATHSPTDSPTLSPSKEPTTYSPSDSPTQSPTQSPTDSPTQSPSKEPTTYSPSESPTLSPTQSPTTEPCPLGECKTAANAQCIPSVPTVLCLECNLRGYRDSAGVCVCSSPAFDPALLCLRPGEVQLELEVTIRESQAGCTCFTDVDNGYWRTTVNETNLVRIGPTPWSPPRFRYGGNNPPVCRECYNQAYGPSPRVATPSGEVDYSVEACTRLGTPDPNEEFFLSTSPTQAPVVQSSRRRRVLREYEVEEEDIFWPWRECSGHGLYNKTLQACQCDQGWKLALYPEEEYQRDYEGDLFYSCLKCGPGYGPPVPWEEDHFTFEQQGPPFCSSVVGPDPWDGGKQKICSGHGDFQLGECKCYESESLGFFQLSPLEITEAVLEPQGEGVYTFVDKTVVVETCQSCLEGFVEDNGIPCSLNTTALF